jgi:cation:H+ antiporter
MALINFVSSSINQWTVLVGMIPFVYSLGMGEVSAVVFGEHQKLEILLTIVQSYLGFLFLASMDFTFFEASGLFVLWLVQFVFPGTRQMILWVYGAWATLETIRLIKNYRKENAFLVFSKLIRQRLINK